VVAVMGALVRVAADAGLLACACGLAARARRSGARRRLPGLRPSGAARWRNRAAATARRRGITADPGQLLAAWALAAVTAVSVGSALGPVWALLGGLAVVTAGPLAWRAAGARAARQRTAAVPDALEHVARELRAGATVPVAVGELAQAPGPLAPELGVVRVRARFLGWPAALRTWGRPAGPPGRRGGAAVTVAASGLAVAAEVGGPAAAALDALAAGLRDEHDRVLEARALATQGRLSAVVVGLAPVGSVALSGALDPRTGRVLVATPAGRLCLLAGLVLDGLAAWWMRRIVAAVA
jgi:tight adherence protein B